MQAIVEAALASPIKSMGLRIFDLRPGASHGIETCGLQRLQSSQGENSPIDQVGDILDRLVTAGGGSTKVLGNSKAGRLSSHMRIAFTAAKLVDGI